jgi:alpha-beta hydrolase superfamily lysophospholipase
MKRKTKVYIFLIVIAVGFVMLNLLAYNHARAMLNFTRSGERTSKPEKLSFADKLGVLIKGVNLPRPVSDLPPTTLAADCQSFLITEANAIKLSAWLCDRGKTSPLVIMFHGYSTDKTALLEEAKALLELGASVLLVDFRGSGGSSEAYTTIGVHEADDVAAVFDYAKKHFAHSRTILFGQSMGAVAILRAISKNGVKPDGVIIEAVFDTMLNTVKNRFDVMGVTSFPGAQLLVFWGGVQFGFNGFKHNPVDYAKALSCPSLFLHGEDDPRAKLKEGRRVFEVAGGTKKFITFAGSGHESYLSTHREQWINAIRNFLE